MTLSLQEAAEAYTYFMQEIADRLAIAESKIIAVNNSLESVSGIVPADIHLAIEMESAVLQIRYSCELIALASLAAHSPIGTTKDLLKSWHMGETFSELLKLNENCFPCPVRARQDDLGQLAIDEREGAPDRQEIQDIYGRCGGLLHRGRLKYILTKHQRIYDYDQIKCWMDRVRDLIVMHTLELEHFQAVFYVRFHPPKGKVILEILKC